MPKLGWLGWELIAERSLRTFLHFLVSWSCSYDGLPGEFSSTTLKAFLSPHLQNPAFRCRNYSSQCRYDVSFVIHEYLKWPSSSARCNSDTFLPQYILLLSRTRSRVLKVEEDHMSQGQKIGRTFTGASVHRVNSWYKTAWTAMRSDTHGRVSPSLSLLSFKNSASWGIIHKYLTFLPYFSLIFFASMISMFTLFESIYSTYFDCPYLYLQPHP